MTNIDITQNPNFTQNQLLAILIPLFLQYEVRSRSTLGYNKITIKIGFMIGSDISIIQKKDRTYLRVAIGYPNMWIWLIIDILLVPSLIMYVISHKSIKNNILPIIEKVAEAQLRGESIKKVLTN